MSKHRYLVDFNTKTIPKEHHDVVIIGSGIAGVFTALQLEPNTDIAILTKETLDVSNSGLAQGGIAVALDKKDSPELHFKDTLYAGAGLCDEESVWVVVKEAAENIHRLCEFGVNFDRTGKDELSLTREAAHSMNRIIHAGDTTGKEICDTLISIVKTKSNINIHENCFGIDLVTEDGKIKGVLVCDEANGGMKLMLSETIVCATGGFGQLYSRTTNPEVATGDGICMAYRAGAELMDLEFVQFHPTVLYHPDNKSFLISEAVRGEGAILRNKEGRRFMPEYHEMAELAPRDVVSRALFSEMKKTGETNLFLDIKFKGQDFLKTRFPNIYKTCASYGIDMAQDYIPVAPAEHYCMGGIKADVKGRTNIEGLYAVGECACNGLHGANRLASNSILEGLVFGRIIAEELNIQLKNQKPHTHPAEKKSVKAQEGCISGCSGEPSQEVANIKTKIQAEMTENVGMVRDAAGLEKALKKLKLLNKELEDKKSGNLEEIEIRNMALLARLVTEAALEREESRGAHYRSDFSHLDDANWKKHIIKKRK